MALPRNLPNLITGSRLVLAAALFVILSLLGEAQRTQAGAGFWHDVAVGERLLLKVCLGIFVTAAITDVLDGHIARRWGLQTDFGRIVDPFADKVIVCGAFVLLVPLEGSPVPAWTVVLILARELLVDGVRGFAESRGVAFPALWSGKLKMVFQSACLTWIFTALAWWPDRAWAGTTSTALVLLVAAITLASGLDYLFHARRVLGAEQLGRLTQPRPANQTGAQPAASSSSGPSSLGGGA